MTTLRLEFGPSRSQSFAWVLRLCRAFPSYRENRENGVMVYSVIFHKKDLKSFEAIWCKVGGWTNTALYLNGELISAGELSERLRKVNADFVYQPINGDLEKPLEAKRDAKDMAAFVRRHSTLQNPN